MIIAAALAFHQSIGDDRKAARLRYLRDRWAKPLQQAADRAKNQEVLNSHHPEGGRVNDQAKRCQDQLGADEVGQHAVQIVEHVFQEFPLWPRLDGRKQKVAEGTAVF